MPADDQGERIAHMEARMDNVKDQITALDRKIDGVVADQTAIKSGMAELKVEITRISRPTLLSPPMLGMGLAVLIALGSFITALTSGSSPQQAATQAAQAMQALDPMTQALLDKLAPVQGLPQDPQPVDPRANPRRP